MTLIISSGKGDAERVEPSGFDKEDRLQEYIHENPESIPLYEVKEDINLLVLAREFQTNSGPIDALAVDADGDLYIIETKLYENHDKRTVIAQSLDYGAGLWKHSSDFSQFRDQLNDHAQDTWNCSLEEKLKNYFELDNEGLNELLSSIQSNLDDGILKFVVLMDSLDDRLKDLVLYVNQNSQFDVYAVEMKHYQHDEYEIMLPSIFGTEVKKEVGGSSSSNRKNWDENSFFDDLSGKTTDGVQSAVRELYEYYKENADGIDWGSGAKNGSFIPLFKNLTDRSLFSVYSDGKIRMQYGFLDNNEAAQEALLKRVTSLSGIDTPESQDLTYQYIDAEDWVPVRNEFIKAIESVRNDFG